MAKFQLLIPDEDRARFVYQAHKEGITLSPCLRGATRERLEQQSQAQPLESVADLEAFFAKCDRLETNEPEPDWKQHLAVINDARRCDAG